MVPKMCDPVCREFQKRAIWVANRMREAHQHSLPLNEETLTDMTLLKLVKKAAFLKKDIQVDAWSHSQENKVGADWDMWICHEGRGMHLRIQAKKLYQSTDQSVDCRYKALNVTSISDSQHQKLWDKCNINPNEENGRMRRPAIPLYVFFNVPRCFMRVISKEVCACDQQTFLSNNVWGCGVSHYHDVHQLVDRTGHPSFDDVRQWPWHMLVCPCFSRAHGPTDPKPSRPLPDILSKNLMWMQESRDVSMSPPDRYRRLESRDMKPHEYLPDWVGIMKSEERDEKLSAYAKKTISLE